MRDILIEEQQIPGNERQNFIFNTFDSLEPDNSITIVSSYDPIDLLKQFNESRPYQFSLEYLVSGPDEWKVKLTKKMKEDWHPLH